jgi:hypothetical protein
MSRYCKVDPRIWNDQKFRKLNDQGKIAFFFLLTHPHMTAIGAMRAMIAGLAAELGWTTDAMQDAIRDAIRHGMVVAKKAWPAALELLPECPEKRDLAIRCKKVLQEIGPNFFANQTLPNCSMPSRMPSDMACRMPSGMVHGMVCQNHPRSSRPLKNLLPTRPMAATI